MGNFRFRMERATVWNCGEVGVLSFVLFWFGRRRGVGILSFVLVGGYVGVGVLSLVFGRRVRGGWHLESRFWLADVGSWRFESLLWLAGAGGCVVRIVLEGVWRGGSDGVGDFAWRPLGPHARQCSPAPGSRAGGERVQGHEYCLLQLAHTEVGGGGQALKGAGHATAGTEYIETMAHAGLICGSNGGGGVLSVALVGACVAFRFLYASCVAVGVAVVLVVVHYQALRCALSGITLCIKDKARFGAAYSAQIEALAFTKPCGNAESRIAAALNQITPLCPTTCLDCGVENDLEWLVYLGPLSKLS